MRESHDHIYHVTHRLDRHFLPCFALSLLLIHPALVKTIILCPWIATWRTNLIIFQFLFIFALSLQDWLRFSVAFWHTFRGDGGDPFGSPTKRWPWDDGSNSLTVAVRRSKCSCSHSPVQFTLQLLWCVVFFNQHLSWRPQFTYGFTVNKLFAWFAVVWVLYNVFLIIWCFWLSESKFRVFEKAWSWEVVLSWSRYRAWGVYTWGWEPKCVMFQINILLVFAAQERN